MKEQNADIIELKEIGNQVKSKMKGYADQFEKDTKSRRKQIESQNQKKPLPINYNKPQKEQIGGGFTAQTKLWDTLKKWGKKS